MSTFGEISEPSSRATWEDWDDLAGDGQLPELQWETPLELPEKVDNFVLIESRDDSILSEEKKNILEINCIKKANLRLYKTQTGANKYICIIKDCDMMLSSDVVKLLKDIITRSKVIVTIVVKSICEYQTEQPTLQSCIIRKVTTTNKLNLMKIDYPKLEQPNIISGVSAGVFNLREHLGLSATSLVFYMESSTEYQIEDMQKLLQKIDISQARQIKQSSILNSNLYM
ncbi:uncharacterized protein PSMG1 [Epargyreus clarus]|uniref:uncharacterized protein PSMG1 n=1 Tax=Epargyreus clarus TaxID=520877 RepID=UPI003C2F5DFE